MGGAAEKRLAKGTALYMLGNMTSKILQMLILPIVTTTLSTNEYGYYDLIITTVGLSSIIITAKIVEGMFRYMFSADDIEKKKIVSTSTIFLLFGIIISAFFILTARLISPRIHYPFLIFLNLVGEIFFNYTQKLARCENKNLAFAISGVINTITMLMCQAITLCFLKMKIDGMLISNCVSYFFASLFLVKCIDIKKRIDFKYANWHSLRVLLLYSLPLVPNALCWWLVASSDRYIIAIFLGSSAIGIYSIASKFSQLLTFASNVFQLAWQESAIIEYDNEFRDSFYTRVFNTYMKILLGSYLFILPFIRIAMSFLLNERYQSGFLYNPILLIAAILAAFSQFYGSAYSVFKKTSGAFITSLVAGLINIFISIILIKEIGLYGPALGTAVSFFIQWILRIYQMRNYFHVKIDIRSLTVLSLSSTIVTFLYYRGNNLIQFLTIGLGLILFYWFNKTILDCLTNRLKNMFCF